MDIISGFGEALTLANLLYAFIGVCVGTIVGILPGIGPALTIALLLPLTYTVGPVSALVMFAGMYYGALYGSSTTSILLRTPGESGSIMTALDGHAMALKGRGGAALATSAIGSFVAGTIGVIVLAIAAPNIVDIALKLQSSDYFALLVLSFVTMASLMGTSVLRGMVSLGLGLVVGLIGIDFQSGQPRLTFGVIQLLDGISPVVLVIGLFAIGEVLKAASKRRAGIPEIVPIKGKVWMTKPEWKRSWKPWLRGAAIGFPLGTIPVGGSEIPTFLSYAAERRLSKHPERFGKGEIEAVAGPEAANNANMAGVLTPLLVLGIPTSATATVMLVAFQNYGIQPGPLLLETHGALVWTLIASMLIGNAMLLILNLPMVGIWVQLLRMPPAYLYAGIATLALLGAYATDRDVFDIFLMVILGILAFVMERLDYPLVPMIIGVILGPIAEVYFRRTLAISNGDAIAFIDSPFAIGVYSLLILFLIGVPIIRRTLAKRKQRQAINV